MSVLGIRLKSGYAEAVEGQAKRCRGDAAMRTISGGFLREDMCPTYFCVGFDSFFAFFIMSFSDSFLFFFFIGTPFIDAYKRPKMPEDNGMILLVRLMECDWRDHFRDWSKDIAVVALDICGHSSRFCARRWKRKAGR